MPSDVVEPFGKEQAFDVVVGEGQGLLVRLGSIGPPVQLAQEVSAGGAEVAVGGQRRIGQQRRQRVKAGLRAVA